MNQVFELAGDLVPPKVAHNLMRLIAEGAGEEDEDADSQLRSSAVSPVHSRAAHHVFCFCFLPLCFGGGEEEQFVLV